MVEEEDSWSNFYSKVSSEHSNVSSRYGEEVVLKNQHNLPLRTTKQKRTQELGSNGFVTYVKGKEDHKVEEHTTGRHQMPYIVLIVELQKETALISFSADSWRT